MKKTILTILIFLSFTGVAYAARKTIYIKGGRTTTYQTPSNYGTLGGPGEATSTSGLVGYWPFDGKYMTWSSATVGTSTDASGNGNNGTLVGMNIATSTVQGKMGQGLNFNGINSYITTGSDFIGTSPGTYSAWIKPKVTGAERIITNNRTIFSLSTLGRVILESDGGTSASSANNAINPNVWTYVVATRNASGVANIYINGVLSGTANQSSGVPTAGTINVNIGAAGGASPFNGTLDDVRIYSRALSATEVQQLYQLGFTTIIK